MSQQQQHQRQHQHQQPHSNNDSNNNKSDNNSTSVVQQTNGWSVQASCGALNTSNPIREIIETMNLSENPNKKVIPLSIGDPTIFGNLKPCKEILDALHKANASGKHYGYQTAAGMESAREAVAEYHFRCTGNKVKRQDVILASGCSHAIDLCICVLAKHGQHILIPRPGFPLYKTLTSVYGVQYKQYNLLANKNWSIDLKHLESLIDENTAAIVINNPSNPCGSVFSRKHLLQILELAERYRKPIIADEIYDKFVFSQELYHRHLSSYQVHNCSDSLSSASLNKQHQQQFHLDNISDVENRHPKRKEIIYSNGMRTIEVVNSSGGSSDNETTSTSNSEEDENYIEEEEDDEEEDVDDEEKEVEEEKELGKEKEECFNTFVDSGGESGGDTIDDDDDDDDGDDDDDDDDVVDSIDENDAIKQKITTTTTLTGNNKCEVSYAPFISISSLSKTVPILTCGGISKTCLIPGLRLGWIVINDKQNIFDVSIRNGLNRLTQRLMGPNSLVQGALNDILTTVPETFYSQTMDLIFKNALLCYERLRLVKGLRPFMPQGSMYLMVRFDAKAFPAINGDLDFTSKLMNEESVLVLPGRCFDFPNYFRICLTVPTSVMDEALERLASFCNRHYKNKNKKTSQSSSILSLHSLNQPLVANNYTTTTATTTTIQNSENSQQKLKSNLGSTNQISKCK